MNTKSSILFHRMNTKSSILFNRMNTKSSIFVAVATSENTSFGVREWNKIHLTLKKRIQIFCFFYAFIYNN